MIQDIIKNALERIINLINQWQIQCEPSSNLHIIHMTCAYFYTWDFCPTNSILFHHKIWCPHQQHFTQCDDVSNHTFLSLLTKLWFFSCIGKSIYLTTATEVMDFSNFSFVWDFIFCNMYCFQWFFCFIILEFPWCVCLFNFLSFFQIYWPCFLKILFLTYLS